MEVHPNGDVRQTWLNKTSSFLNVCWHFASAGTTAYQNKFISYELLYRSKHCGGKTHFYKRPHLQAKLYNTSSIKQTLTEESMIFSSLIRFCWQGTSTRLSLFACLKTSQINWNTGVAQHKHAFSSAPHNPTHESVPRAVSSISVHIFYSSSSIFYLFNRDSAC